MSVSRTCSQCRSAKARCDLARPSCGRCVQRHLACSGYNTVANDIFRNENEIAQRNSRRARKEGSRMPAQTFKIDPPSTLEESHETSNLEKSFHDLQQQFWWLNRSALATLPEPLKRDVNTRAVDRFFVNWILHPGSSGVSPGHLHDLPLLYKDSAPGSVLWLSVRALAFADMKTVHDGNIPFSVKARKHYGAALIRMREAAMDQQALADDRTLAALLLIDNFESMYLARVEPLGPHIAALRHILRVRGVNQLQDRTNFALWRIAHHRLQARQILYREQPDPDQMAWMNMLDIDRNDLHISADVLRMVKFSAAAEELLRSDANTFEDALGIVQRAESLSRDMQELMNDVEPWTSGVTGVWNAEDVDSKSLLATQASKPPSDTPLSHFTCPKLYVYHDIWLAYMWNFHEACQIVLRESLIRLLKRVTVLSGTQSDPEGIARVQSEQTSVERLSGTILRSFPALVGLTGDSTQHGKMLGKFFSLFAMCVVQQSEFAPPEHKATASAVIRWITTKNALD